MPMSFVKAGIVFLIGVASATGDASCAAEEEAKQTLAYLQDIGYHVTEHKFKVINTPAWGANPGNPYVTYNMPLPTFLLDARDAILFVGCAPSKTRYFSWRSYLMFDPKQVFASLGDSVNNLVINTTGSGVYESTSAIITTADANAFEDVSAALGEAGLGDAVNLDTYDASVLKHPHLSTFVMLHRAAVWEDTAAAEAYFSQERAVYHLKAPRNRKASPMQQQPLRQKGTGQAEKDLPKLAGGIAQLETGIASWAVAKGLRELQQLPMKETKLHGFAMDGLECINTGTNCEGDNRDAGYIVTGYEDEQGFKFQINQSQVLVFFGTNSVATGKCTYTNFGLYLWGHRPLPQATMLTVDHRKFPGSAEYFAPHLEAEVASKLFAVALARDCTGIQFCLEVPESQVPMNGQMSATYRAYLEPTTQTGPLVSELVLPLGILYGPTPSISV